MEANGGCGTGEGCLEWRENRTMMFVLTEERCLEYPFAFIKIVGGLCTAPPAGDATNASTRRNSRMVGSPRLPAQFCVIGGAVGLFLCHTRWFLRVRQWLRSSADVPACCSSSQPPGVEGSTGEEGLLVERPVDSGAVLIVTEDAIL